MTFRFVDLFSGLGGFHVALNNLGGDAVFAAEWVPTLQDLYEKNFGIRPKGDITKVATTSVPDHDVLTAGFPCQPFSKAGEQLGFEHTEQGHLFFKVLDILKEKQPSFFILENVPNILKHSNGQTITRIKNDLIDAGYDVKIHQYSPHEFGIPQIRDRVYIVGHLGSLDEFVWPQANKLPTDIRTVLDAKPAGARALSTSAMQCLDMWDRFIKASPRTLELPSFPLWTMEFGATYPYVDSTPTALIEECGSDGLASFAGSFGKSLDGMSSEEQLAALPSHARRKGSKFPKWKQDFIRQNREFYATNKSWIDPFLPEIQTYPSSFQKFEWNAKGENKNLWDFVIQFRASGVRVKRSRTAPSLIAMTDTQVPIIGWERRYMTPRECARLQSLDSIELPESRPAAYRALGNAVNASVVEKIVRPLLLSTPVGRELLNPFSPSESEESLSQDAA
ncbi:DNA (cytosine-5-)-methyltransferase [Paenarthrobacter ureafaciens]|uniref:DNA (cytosine-5-)-methyltransferase n=1 Tax=Paenarthrobacter ureafaciens TaxID=37931 RepID=UPI001C2C95FE